MIHRKPTRVMEGMATKGTPSPRTEQVLYRGEEWRRGEQRQLTKNCIENKLNRILKAEQRLYFEGAAT